MTGTELRERRKALHLTLAQLAAEMHVATATICYWESGKRSISPMAAELFNRIERERKERTMSTRNDYELGAIAVGQHSEAWWQFYRTEIDGPEGEFLAGKIETINDSGFTIRSQYTGKLWQIYTSPDGLHVIECEQVEG